MRQRAMIAMALSCKPRLLIADEPTTALDVTVQAQILELLQDLQRELGMAIMLITHDLGVVAELSPTSVLVMYLGRSVEYGSVRDVFHDPKHPYTVGLLNSIPKLGVSRPERGSTRSRAACPACYEIPPRLRLPSPLPAVHEGRVRRRAAAARHGRAGPRGGVLPVR